VQQTLLENIERETERKKERKKKNNNKYLSTLAESEFSVVEAKMQFQFFELEEIPAAVSAHSAAFFFGSANSFFLGCFSSFCFLLLCCCLSGVAN
jgi:hypothetical protein